MEKNQQKEGAMEEEPVLDVQEKPQIINYKGIKAMPYIIGSI